VTDKNKENEISANAVMNFVNTMIGAFESGFTDRNTGTFAEIYRIAQVHVKDNYNTDVKSIDDEWGPDTAKLCKDDDFIKSSDAIKALNNCEKIIPSPSVIRIRLDEAVGSICRLKDQEKNHDG
jgi:hypothetical protein